MVFCVAACVFAITIGDRIKPHLFQAMDLCLLIMRREAGIRIEAILGVGAEVEAVVSVVVEGEVTVTVVLWLTPSKMQEVTIEAHQFKAVVIFLNFS